MTHHGSFSIHHGDSDERSASPTLAVQRQVGAAGLVDPAAIRVNRSHGRLASRRESTHFQSLKEDIGAAGGNVVPVLGRAVPESSSIELVYGSLCAQACRDLGLPVFIVVQDLLEREVFTTMVREGADGWSLFELGTSIVRALDGGLFASRRALAKACGLKHHVTCAAIEAARLPDFVVQAFDSPNKLTSAAVSRLTGALEADPEGVARRARALLGTPTTSSKGVLAALLGDSASRDQIVPPARLHQELKLACKTAQRRAFDCRALSRHPARSPDGRCMHQGTHQSCTGPYGSFGKRRTFLKLAMRGGTASDSSGARATTAKTMKDGLLSLQTLTDLRHQWFLSVCVRESQDMSRSTPLALGMLLAEG